MSDLLDTEAAIEVLVQDGILDDIYEDGHLLGDGPGERNIVEDATHIVNLIKETL